MKRLLDIAMTTVIFWLLWVWLLSLQIEMIKEIEDQKAIKENCKSWLHCDNR